MRTWGKTAERLRHSVHEHPDWSINQHAQILSVTKQRIAQLRAELGLPIPNALPVVRPAAELFWEKVNRQSGIYFVGDRTECWVWTASRDSHGYGQFRRPGRQMRRAHRWVYEHEVGPTAMHLDHLCRVRHCVRPSHLEPVTQAENNRRGVSSLYRKLQAQARRREANRANG